MVVSTKGSASPMINNRVPKGSMDKSVSTTVDELNEAVRPAAVNNSSGPTRMTLR